MIDGVIAPVFKGDDEDQPWPDLVLIDGGQGQLKVAQETLGALGVTNVPLVAIAKGPDRDAGRETFFMPGRDPFKFAAPRSLALLSSSGCATNGATASPLVRIARAEKKISRRSAGGFPGIGLTRKRASSLADFGTVKVIQGGQAGPIWRGAAGS